MVNEFVPQLRVRGEPIVLAQSGEIQKSDAGNIRLRPLKLRLVIAQASLGEVHGKRDLVEVLTEIFEVDDAVLDICKDVGGGVAVRVWTKDLTGATHQLCPERPSSSAL